MPYYGKYRGTVLDAVDPMQLGRLQLSIPDVGEAAPATWALPCFPPGVAATLPDVGALVWVEFEQGDPARPIWCGVFWLDPAQKTATREWAQDEHLVWRTRSGAHIELGPAGIVIDSGAGASIQLRGPSVSINNGALEIV